MAFQYKNKPSRMAKLVIKYSGGLVKDEDKANYVLLWFAIILFVGIGLSFFVDGTKPKSGPPAGYHFVYPPGEPGHIEKDSDPTL